MPTPTTANRGYQLPDPENELDTDVQRLISALQAIDTDIAGLLVSVSQAALGTHGHVIGDVTGLQAALNDKAAAGHTHAINDLTDVDITGAPAGRPLTTQVGGGVGIGPDWSAAIAGKLEAAGPTIASGYLDIRPYSGSYDDGSRLQSYYNGHGRSWRVYGKSSTGAIVPVDVDLTGGVQVTGDILGEASSSGVIGRAGWAGHYQSSKVQGIWSIGDQYRIDEVANNFGDHFGLVYGYHAAGSGTENRLPIANWGHQILITSDGIPFIGFSMTRGHGWFAGQVGVGRLPGPGNSLDVAGNMNADSVTIGGQPLPTGAPAGSIMPFAASTPPAGWLVCNGATVSRATYAALFAVIGTAFGAGDGSSTFNLPDLRGEFVRGWDAGRGVDAGRAFGSAQSDAFTAHYHLHGFDTNAATAGRFGSTDTGTSGGKWDWESAGFETHAAHTSTEGGAETRPRNVALLYCIKAFDVVLDPAQVSAANVIADVASNTGRIDALEATQVVTPTPYESPLTNMLVGATYSFSHGKPYAPIVVELWAECISTANGYNYGAPIGTQTQITLLTSSLVINRNDTTIEIHTGGSASSIVYGGITIGVISNSPTAANWDIFVRAY